MKVKSIGLFVLVILLAACTGGGGSTPTPVVSATTAVPPSTAVPAATPTNQPLPSSTPTQGRVLLVAPPEAGTALAEAARGVLVELAGAAKLAFETRPALAAADLKPEFKIIVFLQAPADLSAQLAAAPQAQFVVVGSELEAKGNLSVIRQREERRSFMAGYILTMISPDWRSLGLVPNAPATLQDAFINGGRYWCGRCIPLFPPVVLFPLAAAQPAGTSAAGWQAAVTALQKNVLQSVYLAPGVQSAELVKTLFSQKLILAGTQPPAAEIKALWALTLTYDSLAPLKKLWPDLIAGKGGLITDASLTWTDVNETYFTVGKQRLAQETLSGLLDGSINPFTVPDN